jgi:hypothetical protein
MFGLSVSPSALSDELINWKLIEQDSVPSSLCTHSSIVLHRRTVTIGILLPVTGISIVTNYYYFFCAGNWTKGFMHAKCTLYNSTTGPTHAFLKIFWWYWGLNLGPCVCRQPLHQSFLCWLFYFIFLLSPGVWTEDFIPHLPSIFALVILEMGVLETICLDWLWRRSSGS